MTEMISIEQLELKISDIKSQLEKEEGLSKADLQIKYLGKKGLFNELAKIIAKVNYQDKKSAGQMLNELKNFLNETIEKMELQKTKVKWIDLTQPGIKPKVGHMHPVSQAMEEITRIFERIGFTRARYQEIDWDWYVFESLNMPKSHPARDEWETFFIDAPTDKKLGKIVLTTHTSNGQVREMERLNSKAPIRMINIGRCYRRQQDTTHTQMFHQFEGLVIDKGINIQHLKGTLDYFAQEFYGPGTKSRIRPFHFQFTEPSLEVDFSCHICNGTGFLDNEVKKSQDQRNKCKFCKSGWHEVGGAGMVHPNVLKAGGFNPEVYTGFAFGWGVERTYTLKEGLNIDDIRLLYSGDLKFLEQF
ncbi:MAG: phenylalanine--tRNA ligase subunit alpha [Pseudomonadales bacterium]|nr:phenylalanine--tRNA ligase subunit alpha [Pseudomonadales bacterium]